MTKLKLFVITFHKNKTVAVTVTTDIDTVIKHAFGILHPVSAVPTKPDTHNIFVGTEFAACVTEHNFNERTIYVLSKESKWTHPHYLKTQKTF